MSSVECRRIKPPNLLIPKSYPFSWGIQGQSGELLFILGQVSTGINRNVIGPGDIVSQAGGV